MKIIILAGGGGSRLFPLSRTCQPKQFLRVAGEESLLARTVRRFLPLAPAEDLLVVTNDAYIFQVREELETVGAGAAHILTEPAGRNTAPAIALSLAYLRDALGCGAEELCVVTPSDHVISPEENFRALIRDALGAAVAGRVATLGVTPTRPETGYGYIEAAEEILPCARAVRRFTEKPDAETAAAYLARGNYFWNSGLFLFEAGTMREELSRFAPDIPVSCGYEELRARFAELPDISIDYAVAEKSDKMAVVPMGDLYWNDIGSFDAISEMTADAEGNTFTGDTIADDCRDTMLLGNGNRLIAGIGLLDVMVIDTPDVLLVAKKGESQRVKRLVEKLKAEKRKEPEENVTMFRPWGSYTVLAEGEGYKVKRICVKPGASLSLQLHYHRSEHWTVIRGTGMATLDDKTIIFRENESTFIPIGTRHRLSNPGKLPLEIIEVQNGKYLGEDDIVRFDDVYGRK